MEDTSNVEPSVQDEEFEPTAEMMVNDFDDERTLDEEEAMEEAEEQQSELCDLEKEKDMPLEDLMAMYGYNENEPEGGAEEDEEEDVEGDETMSASPALSHTPEETSQQEEKDGITDVRVPDVSDQVCETEREAEETNREEEKPVPSMLHELYKDDASIHARHLRSGSRAPSEEEDEEEDGDYSPEEDDWKKVGTIMVGSDFQAVIPEGLRHYDGAMPYENDDKMLWDPSDSEPSDIEEYLKTVQEIQKVQTMDIKNIVLLPEGSHVRDDEQALYLLQQCGHNMEEAIRRQKINAASSVDTLSLWSEEECRNFEMGIRQHGKDFYSIQQNKVRTRSVSELVQFYYLWKKTERHDVFANKSRLEKKKYTLHPGTTDFMERFLDEQESPTSSPNVHSLISGDPKRQTRTPPPSVQSQCDTEVITADEARIIHTHFEDIARHLDKESFESLVKLAAAAKLPNGVQSNPPHESVPVSANRTSCVSACDSIVTHTTSAAHSYAQ